MSSEALREAGQPLAKSFDARAEGVLAELFGMTAEKLRAEFPKADVDADVAVLAREFAAIYAAGQAAPATAQLSEEQVRPIIEKFNSLGGGSYAALTAKLNALLRSQPAEKKLDDGNLKRHKEAGIRRANKLMQEPEP